MTQDYCITPRAEHYRCMVDLLGRAGHLDAFTTSNLEMLAWQMNGEGYILDTNFMLH